MACLTIALEMSVHGLPSLKFLSTSSNVNGYNSQCSRSIPAGYAALANLCRIGLFSSGKHISNVLQLLHDIKLWLSYLGFPQ